MLAGLGSGLTEPLTPGPTTQRSGKALGGVADSEEGPVSANAGLGAQPDLSGCQIQGGPEWGNGGWVTGGELLEAPRQPCGCCVPQFPHRQSLSGPGCWRWPVSRAPGVPPGF